MNNSGRSVLHIDDDPIQQQIVASMLQGVVDITQATTLQEATRLINNTAFELILLDLTLPDGSGLDLLDTLSDNTHKPPVIISSAHEVTNNLHNVNAVLVKGRYKKQDLVQLVNDLLTEA